MGQRKSLVGEATLSDDFNHMVRWTAHLLVGTVFHRAMAESLNTLPLLKCKLSGFTDY